MGELIKQLEFEFMDNTDYIFKSNNLIESNYNLTVNEQRLIYIAMKKLKPKYVKSNVKPSDLSTYGSTQKFGNLKIYVNEFKSEFNLKGNSFYERLEQASNKLFEREFMYFNNEGEFVKKRWVITSKYDMNGKYVSLTFHPDLILDLLVFKCHYSKLQYNVAKYLNTDYSFRLYELLKNSLYRGYREMTIEEIKSKLEINPDKYTDVYRFKKDVIDKSIKLINEHSDILVEAEGIRTGRRITRINFIISNKSDISNMETYEEPQEEEHIENMSKIVNMDLSNNQVTELTNLGLESIKKHNIDMGLYDYIQEKVDCITQYSKTKVVNNYYGMLKYAIINDWKLSKKIDNSHFSNYEYQTKYDFDDLEVKLLGWDKED